LQEENKALRKACLYSFESNKLNYCGPKNAFSFFKKFISTPSKEKTEKIKLLLKDFYGEFPYLRLIAKENNLKVFDERVVESYWLGNDLLENISLASLKKMVAAEFSKQGMLPKKIAEKKANTIPQTMLPHHSFHVLHINFITPLLLPILKNLNNCMVFWGKVKEVNEEKESLLVKTVELFSETNSLKLREKEKWIKKGFADAMENDFVSIHWQQAIEILQKNQLKNLQKFSLRNLSAL
jgi:hypothetical protein